MRYLLHSKERELPVTTPNIVEEAHTGNGREDRQNTQAHVALTPFVQNAKQLGFGCSDGDQDGGYLWGVMWGSG